MEASLVPRHQILKSHINTDKECPDLGLHKKASLFPPYSLDIPYGPLPLFPRTHWTALMALSRSCSTEDLGAGLLGRWNPPADCGVRPRLSPRAGLTPPNPRRLSS
jgi:hypothetical protein